MIMNYKQLSEVVDWLFVSFTKTCFWMLSKKPNSF